MKKRYEGFNRNAPAGSGRIRRVRASSPAEARRLLAETGHELVRRTRTAEERGVDGGGWGAGAR